MLTDDLNNMQKEAVLNINGPLLLLAGAGSGKTRVITYRIAYMVEQGINPFNILAITFTNKAAKEMKERVNKLLDDNGVWISTFHSMCVKILRQYINYIDYDNNFIIYDTDDSEKILKESIKELNLSDKMFPTKKVMSIISEKKDKLITPLEFEKEAFGDNIQSKMAEIYKLYQSKLKESNALDFDDIIFKTIELFKKNNDILEKYQSRFMYIMVDEYQDTNTSQYVLIKLLSQKNNNICVVGDDDQSIYAWRGANIMNILNFEKDFPGAKVIKLEQNYRSTQNILDVANSVIKNNITRKDKSLWTSNPVGEKIFYSKLKNDIEEGNFIVKKAQELKQKNYNYNDIAILYRQNSMSRILEEQLLKSNIPYRIVGGVKFYDRKEIKDVLAYLKVIFNPKDTISLKRIINVPKRGIGNTTVEKINNFTINNKINFFEALNNLDMIPDLGSKFNDLLEFRNLILYFRNFSEENTISELINEVLEKTNYLEELKQEYSEESFARIENIESFIDKAISFEELSEDKSLRKFLEDISLLSDIDNLNDTDDQITLMTMHSSKGLEYPIVFLPGLEEGIFPSYRSIVSPSKKELEEERRLCYVAITRAKEYLYITSTNSRMHNGKIIYNEKSRFLDEIPKELLFEIYKDNKKKLDNSGISQYSFTKKFNDSLDMNLDGKNYKDNYNLKPPTKVDIDFKVGDEVRQIKYGIGTVVQIDNAGADYEVTVDFKFNGRKKLMANLSKLKKHN